MLFGKLPVILLSTMAGEHDDSINSHIATGILGNLSTAQTAGIRELAELCNVSVSSISRFCKDIGLEDFSELKEILSDPQLRFEGISQKQAPTGRMEDYKRNMAGCIAQVAESLDCACVGELVKDIHRYKKIAAFGLMKAESAAINLQSDLFMLGKQAATKISMAQQTAYLAHCGRDSLVIVFSYTGGYFEYFSEPLPSGLQEAKIYFVTGNQPVKPNRFIHKVICFSSDLSPASHPYQLQFVAHVIAQEYAYYLKGKGKP